MITSQSPLLEEILQIELEVVTPDALNKTVDHDEATNYIGKD